MAKRGLAMLGEAIVADGSTELRKKFPAALFGGRMRLGNFRLGRKGYGCAGAGQQLQTAAQELSGSSAAFFGKRTGQCPAGSG